MPTLKIVFELLTMLIATALMLTLFFVFAKDAFPGMFPNSNAALTATKGSIDLQCNGLEQTFTVTDMGVSFTGSEEKEAFPVLIWGNKAVSSDEFVTMYPNGEGDNVYSFTAKVKFDIIPGQQDIPLPGTEGRQAELTIAFFEKNEYCHDLAIRNLNGEPINGIRKYSTDYSEFIAQCSAKMKGLGIVKTQKAILINCDGSYSLDWTGG